MKVAAITDFMAILRGKRRRLGRKCRTPAPETQASATHLRTNDLRTRYI
jgi:hypothetical protein